MSQCHILDTIVTKLLAAGSHYIDNKLVNVTLNTVQRLGVNTPNSSIFLTTLV